MVRISGREINTSFLSITQNFRALSWIAMDFLRF